MINLLIFDVTRWATLFKAGTFRKPFIVKCIGLLIIVELTKEFAADITMDILHDILLQEFLGAMTRIKTNPDAGIDSLSYADPETWDEIGRGGQQALPPLPPLALLTAPSHPSPSPPPPPRPVGGSRHSTSPSSRFSPTFPLQKKPRSTRWLPGIEESCPSHPPRVSRLDVETLGWGAVVREVCVCACDCSSWDDR